MDKDIWLKLAQKSYEVDQNFYRKIDEDGSINRDELRARLDREYEQYEHEVCSDRQYVICFKDGSQYKGTKKQINDYLKENVQSKNRL